MTQLEKMLIDAVVNNETWDLRYIAKEYAAEGSLFGLAVFPKTIKRYVDKYGYTQFVSLIALIAEEMEVSHGEGTE